MKKLLSIILVIVTALGVLTLCACSKHEHEYDTTWQSDATSHWHVCTGKDCAEIADKADHVYDHACDTTCNVCDATRTIGAVEMQAHKNPNNGLVAKYTSDVVSGQKTQHVFKTVWGDYGFEGWLFIEDHGSAWAFVDYEIRAFDENFVELTVHTESENPGKLDETMMYVDIVDADGNEINETYNGKTIYLMFTLKKTGEDFFLHLQ